MASPKNQSHSTTRPLPEGRVLQETCAAECSVVQVIDNLALGGAQRLLVVLAQHLRDERPLPVLVMSGGQTLIKSQLLAAGADIREESAIRLWNPLSWGKLARALRHSGASAVHLHLSYATILAAPIARWQGRRVIVSLHNADTTGGSGGGFGLRRHILRTLETASLRLFVDQVLFVGDNVAAANCGRIGRTPGVTVPNVCGPVPPTRPHRRDELRKALGASQDIVVVIATGRLSDQKDPLGLLWSFLKLHQLRPETRLWLVGSGPLRSEVEMLCAHLRLGEAVRILGERDDVGDLLEAADIFVLASAWEGLPLGLLEAMARGRPVVATEVGDVPRVLAAGGGILVPVRQPEALARALAGLAADADWRRRLGEEATRSATPFTDVEGWYRQLLSLYRR